MNRAYSLIWLKFVSERNLFFEQRHTVFERFSFLVTNRRFRNAWYLLFFIVRPHAMPILYPVLVAALAGQSLFVAVCGGLYVAGCLFSRSHSLEWKLFDRQDVVLALPKTTTRFLTVFFRNLLLALIVRNSPIVIFAIVCVLLGLPVPSAMLLTASIIFLFAVREMHGFTFRHSTLRRKKLISWSYYFSLTLMETVGYVLLLQGIIGVVTSIINDIKHGEDFLAYLEHILAGSVAAGDFLARNAVYIFLGSGVLCLTCSIAIICFLRTMSVFDWNLRDESSYVAENFAFVRCLGKFLCARQDTLEHSLLSKEYRLFASLYKYNFKNYPRVLLPDSATCSAVITLSYFLFEYPNQWRNTIFCVGISLTIVLELYRRINEYLIAHMSFIADFNTVKVFNAGNYDLKLLLKVKLKFFYSISAVFLLLFFFILNVLGVMLQLNFFMLVSLNAMCSVIVIIFPSVMLTSNVMYTRLDYHGVEAFLTDESSVGEDRVRVFLPVRVFSNSIFYLFLVLLGIVSFMPFLAFPTKVLSGFLIFQLVCLPALALLMNKIRSNMVSSIAQGNYTADFKKIFGENNPVRRFLQRHEQSAVNY